MTDLYHGNWRNNIATRRQQSGQSWSMCSCALMTLYRVQGQWQSWLPPKKQKSACGSYTSNSQREMEIMSKDFVLANREISLTGQTFHRALLKGRGKKRGQNAAKGRSGDSEYVFCVLCRDPSRANQISAVMWRKSNYMILCNHGN